MVYLVENPLWFTERPWPLWVRSELPIYAVEYWWCLWAANDWRSAQDCKRDAQCAGWDVEKFRFEVDLIRLGST